MKQQSGIDEGNAEVLLLKNVTEADSGIYQCNGSNYVGANTKNSTLIVLRGRRMPSQYRHVRILHEGVTN